MDKYEMLWNQLRDRLEYMEQNGNMLQQAIAYSYLGIMRELEDGKTVNEPR